MFFGAEVSHILALDTQIKYASSVAIVSKNVDQLYIRYSNGMEVLGKRLTKSCIWLVSYMRAVTQCQQIGREADECNCSQQRWDDVSANRGMSGTTIIATNYR